MGGNTTTREGGKHSMRATAWTTSVGGRPPPLPPSHSVDVQTSTVEGTMRMQHTIIRRRTDLRGCRRLKGFATLPNECLHEGCVTPTFVNGWSPRPPGGAVPCVREAPICTGSIPHPATILYEKNKTLGRPNPDPRSHGRSFSRAVVTTVGHISDR